MTSINVTLKPCPVARAHEHLTVDALHGAAGCPAAPVLIPCPIPRSVTFSVALGECVGESGACRVRPGEPHHSLSACPARPIRVSCSISGKTWEESAVVDADFADGRSGSPALALCDDRWALVKALVLGMYPTCGNEEVPRTLVKQRDAVFAALADMVRAEQDARNAQQRVDDAFPFARYRRNDPDHRSERPSIGRLAAYVEYLIEQIGTL